MDIPDIYDLDNFNKTPDIIKIITNYKDEYITIYYNGIIDQTIKMEKNDISITKYIYIYKSHCIYMINNMSIDELLLNKKYIINTINIKEEIHLIKPSVRDLKSHLDINFNYYHKDIPEYEECISYIKIFNILSSNIIQLKTKSESIFQTQRTVFYNSINIFQEPDKWMSLAGNIASSILFSKIDIFNERIYIAKIINNLTYDDYIKTIKLTPNRLTDIMVYFYQFKIKSFIVFVLKSIITSNREYVFYKIMNNKIYYDMSNFAVNIIDFYKEISNKSPGEIINPYYDEYPFSYQCF